MGIYSVRKRSFRETRRFKAVDQHGIEHTVVERIAMLHDVGASGCIVDAEPGSLNYYSATSGDAMERLLDGSLKTKDGRLEFAVKPQEA
ncbi:hypothetical protein NF681_02480 (plasmid) [Comamonadaceae bacterium OTU4NAUVB1]|jgi:hypothetical protein|nr:hypothetical protein NF681_02480 [Comamonadaceae bacterium OTU4NAUVB1]HSU20762.1 hypothetical protein [Variovorax sp.]